MSESLESEPTPVAPIALTPSARQIHRAWQAFAKIAPKRIVGAVFVNPGGQEYRDPRRAARKASAAERRRTRRARCVENAAPDAGEGKP